MIRMALNLDLDWDDEEDQAEWQTRYYLILLKKLSNIEKYPFLDIVIKKGKALTEHEHFEKAKKRAIDEGKSEEEAIKIAKLRLIFIRRRFFRNRAKSLIEKTTSELFQKGIYKINDDVGMGMLKKLFIVKDMEGKPISFVSRIFFQGEIKEASVMESLTEKLNYENRIRDLLNRNDELMKKVEEIADSIFNSFTARINPIMNKIVHHAIDGKDKVLIKLLKEYNADYEIVRDGRGDH